MVISGFLKCVLITCSAGMKFIIITRNVAKSPVHRMWDSLDDIGWVIRIYIHIAGSIVGFGVWAVCAVGEV